jgi:hypothetical protein
VILLAYRPFLDPLPVWDYWFLLILPLCAAVTIVYKSIKCRSMSQVPGEAAHILILILLGFAASGAALWGLIKLIEH